MDDLEVRIVELPPMRVARVHAYSATPEHDAWKKLIAWAQPRGLLADRQAFRIFGFNNPDPSPGSPNYGYEFWISVGPETEIDGDAEARSFRGGLYAVTRSVGVDAIGPTWKRLVTWGEDSPYKHGSHQWLEEHLGPVDAPEGELTLDLYMPVAR
ncbi:MAG: GyrI-like domain-containing protein [Anaerolineae bacterium]|nr:GyrI-like domain-containing protein [Anaerolineae bacterium]